MDTFGNSENSGNTQQGASRALAVRAAADGEPWDEAIPRVQSAGVDTIYFSFDVEVSAEMWQRLEAERFVAQEVHVARRAEHCPDWLGACLRPQGAQGGYRFLIETPVWSIKLLRGVPNRPPIFVEMRAFGLHTFPGGELAAARRRAPTFGKCCSPTAIPTGRDGR